MISDPMNRYLEASLAREYFVACVSIARTKFVPTKRCFPAAAAVLLFSALVLPVSSHPASDTSAHASSELDQRGHGYSTTIGREFMSGASRKILRADFSEQELTSLQQSFGVSSSDSSPTLPPALERQEFEMDRLNREIKRGLSRSAVDAEQLSLKTKDLKAEIEKDVRSVAREVKEVNKQLSDRISATPGTQGPPGLPGANGSPGLNGIAGNNGTLGLPGPTGKIGVIGVVGPPGPQGMRGPPGVRGVVGRTGSGGSKGIGGQIGNSGLAGKTDSWQTTGFFCPDGQSETMRLVDCSEKGCRLEVKFADQWGTVCSAGIGDLTGSTVCKALGFSNGGKAVPSVGGGDGKVWLSDVRCKGMEGDIGDCPHSPWGQNACHHVDDVGLCCFGGHPDAPVGVRQSPSELPRCPGVITPDMRLVDCNVEVCRLEVKHNDVWGSVCDNGFTVTTAATVCKMMGLSDGVFKQACATQGPLGACQDNSKGTGPIWLDNLVCSGFERDLQGCRHDPWGANECSHSQDVGVCCSGRAEDFVKPSHCRAGELDYRFNENLQSSTGGPDLSAPWGGTFAGVKGYRFIEGQGLGVDPSGCIKPAAFTVYLQVTLDQTIGVRKLLHSNGWGQYGLYVNNGVLQITEPMNMSVSCEQPILPGQEYRFVLTRDEMGKVRLYVNGAFCASDTRAGPDFLMLNPDQVMFLSDTGLNNPSGYVTRIRVFDHALSEDAVAKICKCKLPVRDKACDLHVEINAALTGITFSSVRQTDWILCAAEGQMCTCQGKARFGSPARGVWVTQESSSATPCTIQSFGGDPLVGVAKTCQCKATSEVGIGYGSSRLNSDQAWSAGSSAVGQWVQMDTGSVQSIAGVVTQGRADANEWVTAYSVMVSADANDWVAIGCGRMFVGNKDRNSKVQAWFHEPVKARYVRIYPSAWFMYMSMRAGILVCERPCIHGQLDYEFPLSFMSSTLGPSLIPEWGEGSFKTVYVADRPVTVYRFEAGQGFALNPLLCMKGALEWTILIDVQLDSVDGYKRILGSQGWGDYGLYVNQHLMMVPKDSDLECFWTLRSGRFFKYVISRDRTGLIKLYVNGAFCASASPSYINHFQVNPNNIEFLHDEAGENSGGFLKNIQMWDKVLPDEEVQAECDCRLPDVGDVCVFTVVFNAPAFSMSFSSVWNDDVAGVGFGSGRLGSTSAWSAKLSDNQQFFQIDTGSVQSITGVLTQGRQDADQWVTSYSVQVSTDLADWRDVSCGLEFDANTDRSTKVKNLFEEPVKARYVRIRPQTWNNWISLRAGLLLCETPCKNEELDYEFTGSLSSKTFGPSLDPIWGEGTFDATGYRFFSGGGFWLDASRCLADPQSWTLLMRVMLDAVDGYRALMTCAGWDEGNGLYVDTFLQIAPNSSNLICSDQAIQEGSWYDFAMTRSDQGQISLYINGVQCASGMEPSPDAFRLFSNEINFLRDDIGQNTSGYVKRIHLWGKVLDKYEVATECGCQLAQQAAKQCDHLIDFVALPLQFKFSSVLQNSAIGTGFARGRLNSRGGWQPSQSTAGQWMQIDTGTVQTIAGLVTQGSNDQAYWVTSYSVKVSDDGFEWKDVRCGWQYTGNVDQQSKQRNVFQEPVSGRFVRIYPTKWSHGIGLRAGVLTCMEPCSKGQLYFQLGKQTLLSSTDGAGLRSPWGSGYFTTDGYRFQAGQGLQVDENEEGCMQNHNNLTENATLTTYTISMTIKFDLTNSSVRLLTSAGWDTNGLFINKKYQLVSPDSSIQCKETMLPGKWYQLGLTRASNGRVSLFVNGGKCAAGSPDFASGFALSPDSITFFHDDNGNHTAGEVKEIHIWNTAFDDAQMAGYSGCTLNPEAKRCQRHISFAPAYANVKFSSTLNNDKPGAGNGQGRLDSPQAWLPAQRLGEQEYMQMDIGDVESLAGIITQGMKGSPSWVTSYLVHVSEDEVSWVPVFCGEIFDANNDSNSKVTNEFRKPVWARYVRIYPQTWYGKQALRAGVIICERPCVGGMLNYKLETSQSFLSATNGPALDPTWGEGSFQKPALGYQFGTGQGFTLDESPCIFQPDNITILMEVSLNTVSGFQKLVGSPSWGDDGLYVNGQYEAYPLSANLKCSETILPNKFYQYMFSRDLLGNVKLYLNGYLCAQGLPLSTTGLRPDPSSIQFLHSDSGWNSAGYAKKITIWSRVLTDLEAATESECTLAVFASPCSATVIVVPSYARLKYSSSLGNQPVGSTCAAGRVDAAGGWCAGTTEVGEYLQIDTGEVQTIEGVVTQGMNGNFQWVTSFKVMVSTDGVHFTFVQCGSIFTANTDMDTKVQNKFATPVKGRFIRIVPQTWYKWMSMRAAVLVCEKPCQSGQLDYQFLDDMLSSSRGPNLNTPWGFTAFDAMLGYRFYGGKGLQLNEGSCIDGNGGWSIFMLVSLDQIGTLTQRLLGSTGWGDGGLFVAGGQYSIMPSTDNIVCCEPLRPGIVYKFMISRNTSGMVKLYLNGYLCASGIPDFAHALALNSNDVQFFHDAKNNNGQGYVQRIRLWGRTLDDSEVAAVSDCRVPPPSNASCSSTIVYSAPYSMIRYSSTYNNDAVGVGFGQGRLNSPQGWSAALAGPAEFMQFDLGGTHPLRGIVTQGRQDYGQWVTMLQVTFSDDGKEWYQVQCGETFKANTDTSSLVTIIFDQQIRGRYVRIWPIAWNNWISMRAAVIICEMQCQGGKLDYPLSSTLNSVTEGPALLAQWGEGHFYSAGSSNPGYRFGAGQGFLLDATHCVNPQDYTILLDAQFDQVSNSVLLLTTKSWGKFGLYINQGTYSLGPGLTGAKCQGLILPGFFYKFGFARTSDGRIQLYLNGYLCSQQSPGVANNFALDVQQITFLHDSGSANSAGYIRRLRLWATDFAPSDFATINECVPAVEGATCSHTVVFNPPYSAVVYSSTWNGDSVGYGHGRGRLDDLQAWSAANRVPGEYMQVDTGSVQSIAGIVTQMRTDWYWQYVSAFSVAVSEDGETWFDVQCGAPFQGNNPQSWNDKDVKLTTMFAQPVRGRYVQIIVQAFVGHPSMRAGILLCEKPCKNAMVDYQLNDQMVSSNDGPALQAIGGMGSFTLDGYRYNWGQGLMLDESSCITDPKSYSIVIQVKLDDSNAWNRLLFSTGWGQAGLFVLGRSFELLPLSLGIVCPGIVQSQQVYQFGITHTSDAQVRLFLNGWMCAAGSASNAPNQLNLAANDVEFFRDADNRNNYGYVSRIRVWGSVLQDKDMTTAMGCLPPEQSTQTCNSYVVKNVQYQNMRFDAVYNNYPAGQVYGGGRLNDPYGWLSPDYSAGHWIQLNLGSVRAVAGVVTQGMSWGWYTTSFSVKVSQDGRKWNSVECGRSFMGNTDWNTQLQTLFTAAVKAQYVRIYPQTYVGYASMRAGAVVCEDPCAGGELDYNFDQTFESLTGGPSLVAQWGMGTFQSGGYTYGSGQGLKILNRATCIEKADTYSAILNVRVANSFWSSGPLSTSWYGLMTSDEWGDAGLYVNGLFMLKPRSLSCPEVIRAQYYYQFGITRGTDGTVTLYLNGYPCASGTPSGSDFSLSPDVIFLRGVNGQSSGGYVKEIRMWDTALSAADMALQSGCSLLTETAACTGLITMNVPYSSMAASSVLGGDTIGSNWGQGQLNSQYAWIPGDWTVGKMWLQLDTGQIQSIAGVVTQGNGYFGYYNWYISSFWVEISQDGYSWTYVECGRIFTGNTDWNSQVSSMFALPVKGRFVRIVPETFNGYPSLRAAVLLCEALCTANELNYDMNGGFTSNTGGPQLVAPWGQGTFQNNIYRFGGGQGLKVDEGACITSSKEYTILMRVNLDSLTSWQPLFTSQEWGSSGMYVNSKYQLKGSDLICSNEPIRSGNWYTYGMSRSKSGTVTLYLNGYKCASGNPSQNSGFELALDDMIFLRASSGQSSSGMLSSIHIWGKTLSGDKVLAQSGCTLPDASSDSCDSQVVIAIPYSQITASTIYAGYQMGSVYGEALLNSPYSWLAYNWDGNQWIQFDAGSKQSIAGIMTQGSATWYAWTTQYKVMVSTDAVTWNYIECGRIFDANFDMNTMVTNVFDYPVVAQYVRIYPQAWYNYVTMRVGILSCEKPCDNGLLDYQLYQTFTSSSDGPSLKVTGSIGSFSSQQVRTSTNTYVSNTMIYSFSQGQGLSLKEKSCLTNNQSFSVIMGVWLNTVSGWQPLMTAAPWDQTAGLYVNTHYMLRSASMQCAELIRTSYYYQYGMTRDSNGSIKLYLNGYPCASGSPSQSNSFVIDSDGLQFFSQGRNTNSGGWVTRIRLWGSTLSDADMAQYSSCSLPKDGAACSGVVEMNVPYSQITASSVWYGYSISQGWGQIQLNSGGSWAPGSWDQNQWIQLDTGAVQMIAGVVTQGSGNYWGYWAYYVTSFWVTVSTDGSTWQYVECGRIFDTYQDSDYSVAYYKKVINRFVKPVKARYVRIIPEGWRNGPMMRAAVLVCEAECKNGKLNYGMQNTLGSSSGGPSFTAPWGDGDFSTVYASWPQSSVSGIVYNFYNTRGGLLLNQVDCIKKNDVYSILMQVQLSNIDISTTSALFTATGWGQQGLYVKGYFGLTPTTIKCSKELIQANYFYWYGITRGSDGAIKLYLNGLLCASGTPTENDGYALIDDDMNFFHGSSSSQTPTGRVQSIQIWNSQLSDQDMQDLTGCNLAKAGTSKCSDSITAGLSISSYSAGSIGSGGTMITNQYCASPQLDTQYAWCPMYPSSTFLQMDTGIVQTITGVVTQGYMYGSYWVQSFRVLVSSDGSDWKQVECGRIFFGNTDYSSKVSTYFASSVQARYVRILPLTWYNYPFLRADVLVCEQACDSGHLDYQMTSMQSATGGPALQTPWGLGSFVPFEKDDGSNYPWWDIQYYPSMSVDDCKAACDQDDRCALVAARKYGNGECWLKYGYGHDQGQGWRPDSSLTILFHIESLLYKVMAPVGYRFTFGQGFQLDESNCITSTTTYSILLEAMFDNVDGQRKLVTSSGWSNQGMYIVNRKLSLLPVSGMQCSQSILPFYSYRFGMSRTKDGVVTLYLNGMPCATGSPSYASGFKLGSNQITFFYDATSSNQEQGWVRRIQLWDDVLSTTAMAQQSGCLFSPPPVTCSKPTVFFPANPKDVDFSSTYNRDDYGVGYGQGQRIVSTQYSTVAQMRADGKNPPTCPASTSTVTLQRACGARGYFATTSGTWNQVRQICQSNGGDLATLTSSADMDAVGNACPGWCYMGLVRDSVPKPWYWVDGSQSTFRSWQGGEPGNWETKAVTWYGSNWNDWANGEQSFPATCEIGSKGWAGVTGAGVVGTLVLPPGDYSSLNGNGNCDDDAHLCTVPNCGSMNLAELSSFQVPDGLRIILYDDYSFRGNSITFNGPVDVQCLVSAGWNDRARSIRVLKADDDGMAQGIGFWSPQPLPNQNNVWGVGEWMQVDLGQPSNISSVKTSGYQGYYQVASNDPRQGSVPYWAYFNWQVTVFILRVSNNTVDWYDVDCATLFQTPWQNAPNTPVTTTLSTPVLARFLRLFPLAWQNGIALKMQVGVCT